MSLRRAASLGAVQTVVSMLAGFLSVKVTSVFLGPAGLGTLGQLQYFIAMSLTTVTSGLNTGIVRRTAEHGPGSQRRAEAIATAWRLLMWFGLPAAMLMAAASPWLAGRLLHDDRLATPVLVFALTYVLGLVATLITGSANGAKDYGATATINIGTVLATLALYALLCPLLGVGGGLLAAAVVPGVTLLIAGTVARKRAWWPRRPWHLPYSGSEARAIAGFIPMAAVGALSLPLVQILVRDTLALHSGMAAVGWLHGVNRISDIYVGLATSVLGMYYLPRFSEIRRTQELKRELLRALAVLVPAVAATATAVYLLRDPIIHLLLTREFLPMRELFGWQMAGSVFKVLAWLLGVLLMAKASPWAVTLFELATYLMWWRLAMWLVPAHGAAGATQAYLATYVIYAACAAVGILFVMRRMRREEALADRAGEETP
jgi:antigen flippase